MVSPYVFPLLKFKDDSFYKSSWIKTKLNILLRVVCKETNVTRKQIKSKNRKAGYVHSRQIFCGLANRYVKAKLEDIRDCVGYVDHTSVIAAIKKFNEVLEVDVDLKELVKRIEVKYYNEIR